MDVYRGYNLATAGWLAIQAVPLLFSPRVIVSLLSQEPRNPTDVENYFGRSLSLTLLALALLTLQLSGLIPLSEFPEADTKSDTAFVLPTLIITTLYHAMVGIYMYLTWSQGGTASVGLGGLASAGLAVVGIWCLLFATDRGHISKRTGADKRTSGFPFKNDIADKRKSGKGL